MEDLQGESVISREDFSYLRNYLHELAQKFRVTYRETWRCSGNEAILSAVRSGHGVTLVSVSYTHLDVYKRQIKGSNTSFGTSAILAKILMPDRETGRRMIFPIKIQAIIK